MTYYITHSLHKEGFMSYQVMALLGVFGIISFLFFVELIQLTLTLIPKRKCVVYDFSAYRKTGLVRKYKI